jgi:spermidine synthase
MLGHPGERPRLVRALCLHPTPPALSRLGPRFLLSFLEMLDSPRGEGPSGSTPAAAIVRAHADAGRLEGSSNPRVTARGGSLASVASLFVVSGVAALLYQLLWQRRLFTLYGVNIESVTVIVTIFMLGLGLGSLLGGLVSARLPARALLLFGYCELGIGVFGAFSRGLIEAVGRRTLESSLPVRTAAIFGLLFVPTVLMGATLPLLVEHVTRRLRHVGGSVGLLYFVNTVGSALACWLAADALFPTLGLTGTTFVAVALNGAVGLSALALGRAQP